MWKKAILIVLILLFALAGTAWLNRSSIMIFLVSRAAKVDVAENRDINWSSSDVRPEQARADGPPNVIVILADDLAINDISTFGGGVAGGRVPTPNIDRLAAEGAIFTNAYSGTATCAPSRAMLMTGRYPSRTGFEFTPTPPGFRRIVRAFNDGADVDTGMPDPAPNLDETSSDVEFADMGLPPEEITIAELLKPEGYHNVHIGKWHLGRAGEFRAVSQGFDESLLMASGLYLPENDPDVVNAKLSFDPIDKFLWRVMQYAAIFDRAGDEVSQDRFAPKGYLTDYWTDESLRVIEANKHRPFFLYLAHWGPHTPLQATLEDYEAVGDIEPHRLRVYAAMVRSLDRSVGRIMTKLEEEGLAENTIIVFSSDNGGAGYVGLPDLNAPYRGWKISLFEGGIRVPMFVKWPAKIPAGTVIDDPVNQIDILPTVAAAVGVELPQDRTIDGRNMLPVATGAADSIDRENDAMFWSSGFYKVVRAGGWKLHVNERQNRKWLFDLANDPTEQDDLSSSRLDKVSELKQLIDDHWATAREPLYPHQAEVPICIDKTIVDLPCEDDEYVIWPN